MGLRILFVALEKRAYTSLPLWDQDLILSPVQSRKFHAMLEKSE
jgi:hypothetical protein